jgi:hypothetical protein
MTGSMAGAGADGTMHRRSRTRTIVQHTLAVIVVAVLLVVVCPWLDRYLIVDDDIARGQDYRHYLERNTSFPVGTTDFCRSAAEEFYGEPILDAPRHGDPTPAEKAFFVGCSGMAVGGYGG